MAILNLKAVLGIFVVATAVVVISILYTIVDVRQILNNNMLPTKRSLILRGSISLIWAIGCFSAVAICSRQIEYLPLEIPFILAL